MTDSTEPRAEGLKPRAKLMEHGNIGIFDDERNCWHFFAPASSTAEASASVVSQINAIPRPTTDTVGRAAMVKVVMEYYGEAYRAKQWDCATHLANLADELRALPSAGGGEVEKPKLRVMEICETCGSPVYEDQDACSQCG